MNKSSSSSSSSSASSACIVVKQPPKAGAQKSTKSTSNRLEVVQASQGVMAPNGKRVTIIPKTTFTPEVVEKLSTLPAGGELFIHKWREVSSKFGGKTFILYTFPDEEGYERAYWANYGVEQVIKGEKVELGVGGLYILKDEDGKYTYGSFDL